MYSDLAALFIVISSLTNVCINSVEPGICSLACSLFSSAGLAEGGTFSSSYQVDFLTAQSVI